MANVVSETIYRVVPNGRWEWDAVVELRLEDYGLTGLDKEAAYSLANRIRREAERLQQEAQK